MLPHVSEISRDDTHRLIPSRYSDREDSVLTRLTDDPDDLNVLFELEGATNDRLVGEAGLLPGISVRELVFGISYSPVVNAAFTWQEKETFSYVDFLADFRGQFHDIRNDGRFGNCLDPVSYKASQNLAAQLLVAGSAGIVYSSVRHKGGICIACFRPALVNNVRKGASVSITFENASARPEIREIQRPRS